MSEKKFYFFYGRNQFGEERIANYFHSKGYVIVRPEKLPIDIQLNIFANCEEIASMAGSVSHNVIFLKNNSNVLLIPRRSAFLNIYQTALNEVHNLNVSYIDSAISLFAPIFRGPYCYILSENLRKHFGDDIEEKYTDEDFAIFLLYLRHSKSCGLKENPMELEYMKNILPEFMEQLKTRTDLLKKFGINFQ